MMDQGTSTRSTHYSRCAYTGCGSCSRDGVPGLKFFSLPVSNRDRCMTWLVNSGLDDHAELSDSDLKKIKICGLHFSHLDLLPCGRLRNHAVPTLYPIPDSDEDMQENDAEPKQWEVERLSLLARIARQKKNILKLKRENSDLRGVVKSKTQIIRRLTTRLQQGIIANAALAKAVARKVQGFLLSFVMMQLFHKNYGTFTEDEKQLALKMHYTSPSLYAKMREDFGFVLPSQSSIKEWFGKIKLWPGISCEVFRTLKTKVSCMRSEERNCVLLFDEMRIRKAFDLHDGKQKIEGFEDFGSFGCSSGVATNALVFMVRGLLFNWKQPVAYFLSAGTVTSGMLNNLIDAVLDALFEAGLCVRAIVCDQGTNNRSALSSRVTADRPHFSHRGFKVFCLFDVPHLFKSIRNQLLLHDIQVNDNARASWNDVKSLWNLESGKGTRAACKLTEKHVYPSNFERMKCRLALQVFSRRVSAALFTASSTGGIQRETVTATANFFLTLNDLFDNLNSRCANDRNPNRCAISDIRPNVEANVRNQLEACRSWRTITRQGLKIPPCFEGLVLTLTAILQLWNDLKLEGIKFLMTERLNQDAVENLFSMVRMYGGTYNQNPSAKMFRLILQKNAVMNLNRPAQSANCLDDEDDTLIRNDEYNACDEEHDFAGSPGVSSSNVLARPDEEPPLDVERLVIDVTDREPSLESSAIEYFAGYVLKKCIAISKCQMCTLLMINPSQSLEHDRQLLTFFRAYETRDNLDLGHLCVPSDEFSMAFRLMNAVFDVSYPSLRGSYSIQDTLFPIMVKAVHVKYPGWFEHESCGTHRKDFAYFMMRVKIRKDLVWLGERLRNNQNYRTKPSQKLKNLQSA